MIQGVGLRVSLGIKQYFIGKVDPFRLLRARIGNEYPERHILITHSTGDCSRPIPQNIWSINAYLAKENVRVRDLQDLNPRSTCLSTYKT